MCAHHNIPYPIMWTGVRSWAIRWGAAFVVMHPKACYVLPLYANSIFLCYMKMYISIDLYSLHIWYICDLTKYNIPTLLSSQCLALWKRCAKVIFVIGGWTYTSTSSGAARNCVVASNNFSSPNLGDITSTDIIQELFNNTSVWFPIVFHKTGNEFTRKM